MKQHGNKPREAAILIAAIIILNPINTFAMNTFTIPLDSQDSDLVLVELPAEGDRADSPFNFILDPQKLIYRTNAVKYGERSVEESATLLFENSEGEYGFSSYSDRLNMKNKSTVPVKVTITAKIEGLEEIGLVQDDDFSGNEEACIYLAIVDNKGNEQPIMETGEASIETIMDAAPDNAYAYCFHEETQSYSYEQIGDPEFDVYSFGLTGACNTSGKWEETLGNPIVTVTWTVEALTLEESDNGELDAPIMTELMADESDISETEAKENNEEKPIDIEKDTQESITEIEGDNTNEPVAEDDTIEPAKEADTNKPTSVEGDTSQPIVEETSTTESEAIEAIDLQPKTDDAIESGENDTADPPSETDEASQPVSEKDGKTELESELVEGDTSKPIVEETDTTEQQFQTDETIKSMSEKGDKENIIQSMTEEKDE